MGRSRSCAATVAGPLRAGDSRAGGHVHATAAARAALSPRISVAGSGTRFGAALRRAAATVSAEMVASWCSPRTDHAGAPRYRTGHQRHLPRLCHAPRLDGGAGSGARRLAGRVTAPCAPAAARGPAPVDGADASRPRPGRRRGSGAWSAGLTAAAAGEPERSVPSGRPGVPVRSAPTGRRPRRSTGAAADRRAGDSARRSQPRVTPLRRRGASRRGRARLLAARRPARRLLRALARPRAPAPPPRSASPAATSR